MTLNQLIFVKFRSVLTLLTLYLHSDVAIFSYIRKLFVQHRVYELANYLASKELNSTLYKDEVGDELFDLCTEMILANHALFKGTASTFSSPEAQIMIFAEVLKEFHAGTLLTVFSVVLYQVRHTKTNHDMSSLSIAISTHSDAITEQGGLVS